jgi:hypothetical protein
MSLAIPEYHMFFNSRGDPAMETPGQSGQPRLEHVNGTTPSKETGLPSPGRLVRLPMTRLHASTATEGVWQLPNSATECITLSSGDHCDWSEPW